MEFIGRKTELETLNGLLPLQTSRLVVIKGRRRIGKSRLVEEFSKGKCYLPFSGMPPTENTTKESQLAEFSRQLGLHFKADPILFTDWFDAFEQLLQYVKALDQPKPIVIMFDEISWVGSKAPDFIPKLKIWWDKVEANSTNVILIICGSISTWIEENIINNPVLFGHIFLLFNLSDLSLPEANQFLAQTGVKGSPMDLLKILSITGGVPWYLEHIHPDLTADENIKDFCFKKNGFLIEEYNRIFHDLFNNQGTFYKKILNRLSIGPCAFTEPHKDLKNKSITKDMLQKALNNLIAAGFVSKYESWSLNTDPENKKSLYRLSDNYICFYLKYMEPNLEKIKLNHYQDCSLNQLPGWETIMGLQIETLLLKNRHTLIQNLGIASSDVVASNPYVQKPTETTKGCQIDYLIQTQSNTLYVCEFKFRKKELGTEIIQSMQNKIANFAVPEGFGVVPVLVHASGVQPSVRDANYFYRILNIADFLV